MGRRNTILRLFIPLLLLLCAADFPDVARPAAAAGDHRVGRRLDACFRQRSRRRTARRCPVPAYQDSGWHPIRRMPATVLQILQEDGVYPDLYFGTNLLDKVPQDLYKQDWWYRTTFTAPAGHTTYSLEFPGINYRAEIWLNGRLVADNKQIVGMYGAHELDVAQWIKPGESQHPGGQGHPGASAAGRRRCGTGGQLVRLDQLELPRATRGRGRIRPTATRSFRIAMPASGNPST